MSRPVWASLLRGGLIPAVGIGAVVTLASVPGGTGAIASAVLGTVLAVGGLATGPLVLRSTRRLPAHVEMAIAIMSYGVVIGLLGGVYLALGGAAWVSGMHVGVAVIVCTVAWVAGMARATTRLRILAYGDRPDATPYDRADPSPRVNGR